MFTKRIAEQQINDLNLEINKTGIKPKRAMLFASVAKEKTHKISDIDVAIWADEFCGSPTFDYELILKSLRNFPNEKLHTYNTNENHPFVVEIEKSGIEIEVEWLFLISLK